MCPKPEIFVYERQDSVSPAGFRYNMMPAVQNELDYHNSGLSSMNLPSIDVAELYSTSSIEHAFSHMKIDSEHHRCSRDSKNETSHYDSGVYAIENSFSSCISAEDVISKTVCETRCPVSETVCETRCPVSETVCETRCPVSETVCEIRCLGEDIPSRNNSHCVDIASDSETSGSILTEITERLFEGDKDGDNSLHLSIITGYSYYSHLFINLAPEYHYLNYCNNLRQTPLHLAVLTQQPEIVRRLVCAGASVLAQDQQGNTPLHIACGLGDEQVIKHLLTPVLYEETIENKYSIPYQRMPQDLRIRNYEGQTCLHLAVIARKLKVVQILLDAGADINVGDGKSGRSVLHLAADTGDFDMVEMLLSSLGIEVNREDYAGFTPAQLAQGRNHLETARLIFSIGDRYDDADISDDIVEDSE